MIERRSRRGQIAHFPLSPGGWLPYTYATVTDHIIITTEYSHQADELERLVSGCSEQAVVWRPDEDRWSILEIAAHLADAELLAATRIRRIVTQDRPNLYGYEQNLWALRLGYRRMRIENVVRRFAVLRRDNAELLATLPAEVWQRLGQHDEDGELTLARLIEGYIAHTAKHLNQMRAAADESGQQTTTRTER